MTPSVSVVLPHYDDLANLEICLRLLAAQSVPLSQFEVVVADNNSRCGLDAVRAVAEPFARVVPVSLQGAANARNGGVAETRGEILAFIDSDCRPEPGWLAAGIEALNAFDLVGGKMSVGVVDRDAITGPEAFELVFAFDNRAYVEKKAFSVTANLFTTRRVFDAVGGFRGGVPEDLDWCLRARDAGFRIGYADRAEVEHPARHDRPALEKKWGRLQREAFEYARSVGPGLAAHWLRGWAVLVSIVPHAGAILRSPRLHGARERTIALETLVRIRIFRFLMIQRMTWAALAKSRI